MLYQVKPERDRILQQMHLWSFFWHVEHTKWIFLLHLQEMVYFSISDEYSRMQKGPNQHLKRQIDLDFLGFQNVSLGIQEFISSTPSYLPCCVLLLYYALRVWFFSNGKNNCMSVGCLSLEPGKIGTGEFSDACYWDVFVFLKFIISFKIIFKKHITNKII